MIKKSIFDPRPVGVLSDIFRYWAYLHQYTPAMEAEMNRQVQTGGIEVYPPLHPDWHLRQASYEFSILTPMDDGDTEWTPAAKYAYRILRWHEELYGPTKAVSTVPITPAIQISKAPEAAPVVTSPEAAPVVNAPPTQPSNRTKSEILQQLVGDAAVWVAPLLHENGKVEDFRDVCMDKHPGLSASAYDKRVLPAARLIRGWPAAAKPGAKPSKRPSKV